MIISCAFNEPDPRSMAEELLGWFVKLVLRLTDPFGTWGVCNKEKSMKNSVNNSKSLIDYARRMNFQRRLSSHLCKISVINAFDAIHVNDHWK